MSKENQIKTYVDHTQKSIDVGLSLKSKADSESLDMYGMSTPTFRGFLNELCSKENSNYLEIGTWTGGTCCSAISNNLTLKAFLIDNFSYLQDEHNVRNKLINNIRRVSGHTDQAVTFIEGDCFALNKDLITEPIDFYFFDALHTKENQRRALTDYLHKLADVFVFVVDDYNEKDVREGTEEAFEQLGDSIKIEKEWQFDTNDPWDPIWHNGVRIFVISKSDKRITEEKEGKHVFNTPLEEKKEEEPKEKKMHLGCGDWYLEGWINTDGYQNHKADLYFDFSKPFPIHENVLDAIVSQHAIEHTDLDGGINFINECYKTLKPGGKIRISCPDLELLIGCYVSSHKEGRLTFRDQFTEEPIPGGLRFRTACQYVNELVSGWGHRYIYDYEDIEMKMKEAGFKNIKRMTETEMSPVFEGTECKRPASLYVEAEK